MEGRWLRLMGSREPWKPWARQETETEEDHIERLRPLFLFSKEKIAAAGDPAQVAEVDSLPRDSEPKPVSKKTKRESTLDDGQDEVAQKRKNSGNQPSASVPPLPIRSSKVCLPLQRLRFFLMD